MNPMDNLAITVGYEGSRFNFNGDNEGSKASTNGFNVSLGYRF
ncbi:hypothetical protein O0544_12885 [Edwardsiella anguillarum]|nr:hypothetical protein [Edwardsiella anguillarum]